MGIPTLKQTLADDKASEARKSNRENTKQKIVEIRFWGVVGFGTMLMLGTGAISANIIFGTAPLPVPPFKHAPFKWASAEILNAAGKVVDFVQNNNAAPTPVQIQQAATDAETALDAKGLRYTCSVVGRTATILCQPN